MGKVIKIREVGDPILSQICEKVNLKNINQEILDTIDDLKETLSFGTGLGISAPQIGINKRIIVVGAKKENINYNDAEEIPITAMINLSWKKLSDDTDVQFEGCMSVPSIRGKVERYKNIELTYYNENGEKIVIDIPFDNGIKYLEGKEIIDAFTTETGIIYLGYSSCPWCRNIIEPLIEVAKENDIDTIYYVNTYDNEFDSIKGELKEILNDYLRVDEETNQKVLATPDVYFIKDGKIKTHHISTVESYRNPYRGMNDEQIKELKAIYQAGIEEIK